MEKKDCLYSFESTDLSGNKKVFGLLKPSRKQKEDGDLYYASKLSEFISAGILPKILWDKLFKNNGGTASNSDKEEYANLWNELVSLTAKANSEKLKNVDNKSSEELSKINDEISSVKQKIQELELFQVNAFENTAEAKARNKSIIWWTIELSAEKDSSGKWKKILDRASIEENLDLYDEIAENNEFLYLCLSRLNYLVTLWYLGSASSEEEFKRLDDEGSYSLSAQEDKKNENEKTSNEFSVEKQLDDKKIEEKDSSNNLDSVV
jgi:hypothetical protein